MCIQVSGKDNDIVQIDETNGKVETAMMSPINLLNEAGLPVNPNGSRLKFQLPALVMNAVLCLSLGWSAIWKYPLLKSKVLKNRAFPKVSRHSLMSGRG